MHAHIQNPKFMEMAEMSTFDILRGRNAHCRNVQAETSVAEMSVAECLSTIQTLEVLLSFIAFLQ